MSFAFSSKLASRSASNYKYVSFHRDGRLQAAHSGVHPVVITVLAACCGVLQFGRLPGGTGSPPGSAVRPRCRTALRPVGRVGRQCAPAHPPSPRAQETAPSISCNQRLSSAFYFQSAIYNLESAIKKAPPGPFERALGTGRGLQVRLTIAQSRQAGRENLTRAYPDVPGKS